MRKLHEDNTIVAAGSGRAFDKFMLQGAVRNSVVKPVAKREAMPYVMADMGSTGRVGRPLVGVLPRAKGRVRFGCRRLPVLFLREGWALGNERSIERADEILASIAAFAQRTLDLRAAPVVVRIMRSGHALLQTQGGRSEALNVRDGCHVNLADVE